MRATLLLPNHNSIARFSEPLVSPSVSRSVSLHRLSRNENFLPSLLCVHQFGSIELAGAVLYHCSSRLACLVSNWYYCLPFVVEIRLQWELVRAQARIESLITAMVPFRDHGQSVATPTQTNHALWSFDSRDGRNFYEHEGVWWKLSLFLKRENMKNY